MGQGAERVLQATPDGPLHPERARRVAEVLAAGGLVALPTETVYGLGARADDRAALGRLVELKGGPADRPLTWHAGSAQALERFPRASPVARRLAERYWPGPLTLVLDGVPAGLEAIASEGWTGVRMPAHPLTAPLLAALDFPLVLTSANRAGRAPATSAQGVQAEFGDGLDLVVDAGPSRLGEASAVLRVGRGRFELLREGLYDLESLRKSAGLRLAFCCTGNTCRSPMAEGLARALLARRLEVPPAELWRFGFEVSSMGAAAFGGSPASPRAVEVLAERGIDLAGHVSRPATAVDLAGLDWIFGLTHAHVEAVRLLLPPGRGPRVELLDPAGADVPDPIGGDLTVYRAAADRIETALRARLDDWA